METLPPASVPLRLRSWFVVHFVADIVFAIPLLVVPVQFLTAFGWTCVDTVSARLVGAALIGIGGESWFGRNQGLEGFRTLLRLKCLWSGAAVIGIAASILEGAPPAATLFLGIFGAFAGVWNYYRIALGSGPPSAS